MDTDEGIKRENSGKPLTPGKRQVVVDEVRAAPHLSDDELARLVAPGIGRFLHRSTVQRIRKENRIPDRRDAVAEMPVQLNERDAGRLRGLLGRMFVPDLAECGWNPSEVQTGLLVRPCRRGDLYEYRARDHVSRLWFSPAEETEFLDLVGSHSGLSAGRRAAGRYRRLAASVARQLDLVRGHGHAFYEGIEPDSLLSVQRFLEGGTRPGPGARAAQPFKLVSRHPRLAARVDEFVARVRARLRV